MSKKNKKKQQAQANSSQAAGKPAQGNPSQASGKSTPQNSAAPSGSKAAQSQSKSGSSRTNKTAAPSSFFQRLLGVITLKAPIYRELAHDTNGTMQAAIVVVVVALVVGAIAAYGANLQLFGAGSVPGVPVPEPAKNPLGRGIVMVIQELLIWVAGAYVIAAVAKNMFRGKTDTGEMLRVFGFTRVFQILLVLGVFNGTLAAVVSIAGLVLSIIGSVIGIREATGFTTGRAAIIGVFAITLVAIIIAFFTAFVLNPIVTTLLPT